MEDDPLDGKTIMLEMEPKSKKSKYQIANFFFSLSSSSLKIFKDLDGTYNEEEDFKLRES